MIHKKNGARWQAGPKTKHSIIKPYHTANRLIGKELNLVRRGLNRYSYRAVALAGDFKSVRGAHVQTKLIKLERDFVDILRSLEDEVANAK